MIFLLILIGIILAGAIIAFDAYLFATHIPTLIADPSNFGAWVWVVIALAILIGGNSAASNR